VTSIQALANLWCCDDSDAVCYLEHMLSRWWCWCGCDCPIQSGME